MYCIEEMSYEYVQEIIAWKYPEEYAFYNLTASKDLLDEMLNGKYYVCLDNQKRIIGYFSFQESARIIPVESDAYDQELMDIGLGLRPDLCGHGYGADFLHLGMGLAREKWGAANLRLSVATFNRRAIKTYEKVGFRIVKEITHQMFDGMKFYVMVYGCASHI